MAGPDYTNAFQQISQGPGLLQTSRDALTLRHQMLQVEQEQQALRAREAMGPILQNAIDPETGDLNYNKAFVGMAANPATAFMAPDFLDKAVARQGTQAETALKELEKNMKQQNAIYDGVTGLLRKGQTLTQKDMLGVAKELVGAGVIDKDHYVNFARQLPQDGAPLLDFAKQIALRAQGAAKSLETVYQKIGQTDTGGAEVFTQPQPLEGTVRQVGVLPKTLAPAQAEELVEGKDPSGAMTGVPGATFKAPRSQLFPSGSAEAPASQQGGRGLAPPGAPARGVITGMPPQTVKAWEKMGEGYDKILSLAQTNQGVIYALDTAEDLLKRYSPSAGAETRAKIADGLAAIGVDQKVVDAVNNGSMAAGQVFKSVMLDLATNRMKKALEGGGRFTNIEFQTFNETKPNPNMSTQAVRELIQYYRRGVKLDQMYIRGYNHFLQNGKSPTDFENWWQDRLDDLQERRRKSND